MGDWKPKPKPDAKTEDMNLTGEEGFVLSRVDGFSSVDALANATGLPEVRVRQILKKLVRQGAVDGPDDAASFSAPSPSPAARPAPPKPRGPAPVEMEKLEAAPATVVDELSQSVINDILGAVDGTMDDAPPTGPMTETDHGLDDDAPAGGERHEPQLASLADDDDANATSEDARVPGADGEDAAAADEQAAGDGEGEDGEEANYRKLYNTELSKLEQPEREALAKIAIDPQLSALCFDPQPMVIKQIFENPKAGFTHARLVARHHRTPQGIDHVMHRAEFFRDAQVQRLLLQNTMLQEPQLKRILQAKRLAEVYKVCISREIPERNRQKSRNVLRSKWTTTDGEERAGLIFTTEGRCLNMLQGLPFDSQTTTLLCQRTYTSLLLIQNLARHSSSPPQVLAHLLRQPPVKRQPQLRTLITQHPNCPADAKRRA